MLIERSLGRNYFALFESFEAGSGFYGLENKMATKNSYLRYRRNVTTFNVDAFPPMKPNSVNQVCSSNYCFINT